MVVEKKQLTIDDLEGARIYFHFAAVLAHCVGAPAAVLGFIMGRVLFKFFFIGGGGKIIGHALVGDGIFLTAFYRLVLGKISDGIVSADSEALVGVEVFLPEGFVLGESEEAGEREQECENELLHLIDFISQK